MALLLHMSMSLSRTLSGLSGRSSRRLFLATYVRTLSSSSSPSSNHNTTSFLRLPLSQTDVFLVGTAHISQESAREVRQLISTVKPDVVAIELCRERAQRFQNQSSFANQNETTPDEVVKKLLKALGVTQDANALGLGGAALKAVVSQMYRGLRMSGLEPGKEFQVAMEEASNVGAKLALIDREQDATFAELRKAIKVSDVMRFMFGGATPLPPELASVFQAYDTSGEGMQETVERLKNRETIRAAVSHLREQYPQIVDVILDQRDEFMAEKIKRLRGSVVAVVGMAHMDGIERRLRQ